MQDQRRHAVNGQPNDSHEPARHGRETMLTIVLTGILGGAFLMFLNFVTFGLFFWVGATVIGIVIVGYLHYVLWGEALSHDVADEREKQAREDQQQDPPRRF